MDNLTRQFGLIIAYVLPGFVALAGVAPLVPTVATWLRSAATAGVGAPLYTLLAATAVGMVVSCFRWLLIDPLHEFTGVTKTRFNVRALEEQTVAFNYLVESHYRYYQFYANVLVATVWTYFVNRLLRTSSFLQLGSDIGFVLLCIGLFIGSRDSLKKYRQRNRQLGE